MKKKVELAALFLLFLLLGVSRRVYQLQYPDVWDEDGYRFIPGIINKGIASVIEPLNGYILLVPRLLSLLSLQISFYNYALISSVFSFILIALVALAVAKSPTMLKGKLWCALALLFIPTDPEVFGLSLYTFWWTSVLLFLLVLWDEQDSSIFQRTLYMVAGGLSSPVIVALLPLFYWRSYTFRTRPAEHFESLLATVIAGFQLQYILSSASSRIPSFRSMLEHLIPKFFGAFVVGNLKGHASWIFGLAVMVLVAFWMYDSRFRLRYSTRFVLLYLLAASIALSIIRVDPAVIHQRLAGPRYFFYPYLVLFWVLIQIGFTRKWYGYLACAFIVTAMLNALPVWARSHDDLHWRDHVLSSYFFPHYTFPIQSNGNRAVAWRLTLSANQYSALLEKERFHSTGPGCGPVYPYTMNLLGAPGAHHYASAQAHGIKTPDESDFGKPGVKGFRVVGTYATPGGDKGEIILVLNRGDCILYRTGTGPTGARVIIAGREKQFLQELPVSRNWACLEFSNRLLPERFYVRFIEDRGEPGKRLFLALKNSGGSNHESKSGKQ